jgi:hypothetical protein
MFPRWGRPVHEVLAASIGAEALTEKAGIQPRMAVLPGQQV